MCWNGQGTTVYETMENSFDLPFWTHIPSHKKLSSMGVTLWLKLGMKYKLEADFTRDQKEGHFTKSFDPHKLRNIHPVLTWTMSSIFLWISWDLSYLNYYLPLCNGQGAMIFLVLNYCHFVKSKKKEYFLSQTPLLNFFVVNKRKF